VLDDSDGITLQSLGGVFIATLIGLGLALLTLAVEVVLQKKKDKSKVVTTLFLAKFSAIYEFVGNRINQAFNNWTLRSILAPSYFKSNL